MFDGQQLGETIVAQVKGYLEREVAPLRAENANLKERLAAIEARPLPAIDLAPVEKLIADEIAKLPVLEPAKDVDMEAVAALVGEAVAALPPAKDGASVTADDLLPLITEEVAKATDPRDINAMVSAEVAKAIAALPVPKDGKDAANIVEALKDSGELVLTLQDGRLIRTGIRDGKDGDPGLDGLGFDEMDACVLDDDRTIELSFRRGDEEKAFTFKWPAMIYRGVWSEGTFSAGDATTWGGSLWIAEKETSAKPDTSDSGWKLAVKKGRDGKDAKVG